MLQRCEKEAFFCFKNFSTYKSGFIPLLRNTIYLVKSNLVLGQIFLRIWRLVVFMMKL